MTVPRSRALRFLPTRTGCESDRPVGFLVDASGRLETVEDTEAIRQSILLLLATRPGERIMRPGYGCDLHRLVFQPNDATTAGLTIHYVRQAIERWEPRVELTLVDAYPAPDESEFLVIEVEYRIRRTHQVERIVRTVSLAGD